MIFGHPLPPKSFPKVGVISNWLVKLLWVQEFSHSRLYVDKCVSVAHGSEHEPFDVLHIFLFHPSKVANT